MAGDATVTLLQQAEQLLIQMTAAEKAQLLQRVAQDLDSAPGIERTPGVVGGAARVVRTRIPVWTLVQARRQGLTEVQILEAYPSLRAEDLANTWAYARAHPDEVDKGILENEAA